MVGFRIPSIIARAAVPTMIGVGTLIALGNLLVAAGADPTDVAEAGAHAIVVAGMLFWYGNPDCPNSHGSCDGQTEPVACDDWTDRL